MDFKDDGIHEYDIGDRKAKLDTFLWFLALQEVRAKVGKPNADGGVTFDPLVVAAEFRAVVNDGRGSVSPALEGADGERPVVSTAVAYSLAAQIDAEFDRVKKNIDGIVNSSTSPARTTSD